MNDNELQAMGYKQKFDYSQYSHDNDVNVIPKNDFKRLIRDTFKTITDIVKETYGPYGSTYTLNEMNQTSATKDGYNTFEGMHFSHQYKQMVKLNIGKICSRVNEVVGDGTTSCLLLADKIFDSLNDTLKTSEDERLLVDILDDIAKFFNDSITVATDRGMIKPLNQESLESVIMMACNNNKRMRDTLVEALNVSYDNNSNVTSINNVVIKSKIDPSVSTHYEIHKLPGDYRVEANINLKDIGKLTDKKNVVIVAYDHNFNAADYGKFIAAYINKYALNKPASVLNDDGTLTNLTTDDIDRPTILVCATGFDKKVIDDDFYNWMYREQLQKRDHNIIFATIRGTYAKNEIRDLCAVIDTKEHTIYTPDIKIDEFDKYTTVSFNNNDCLCVYGVKPPTDYIESLSIDMENDDSSARRKLMKKRIDAMSMMKKDTIIDITVPNTLEQKMIEDKIDDCISIIESAFEFGCVPNLLKYAHTIMKLYKTNDERSSNIARCIIESIEGIFHTVWVSKNGPIKDDEIDDFYQKMNMFYNAYEFSYDIIKDTLVPMEKLSTSVQYDVEVVCATLEIVKYLLTSRGLIFDSCLLQMHGDKGTYVPV